MTSMIIRLFSGDERLKTWSADKDTVMITEGNASFKDIMTGKTVYISGTFIIEEEKRTID